MRPDDLELVIEEAFAELPDEVRANLEGVDVLVVTDHRDPLCAAEDPDLEPGFLGVYCGTQLAETLEDLQADDPSLPIPPPEGRIYLNASTISDQDEALITLHHEIGHALGLSEEEVADLGLTPEELAEQTPDAEGEEEADQDEDEDDGDDLGDDETEEEEEPPP
jgi:predicted Zn-dependent protease with MMP-like domain